MNFSELNGEALNEGPRVFAEGSSEIVCQSSGELAVGLGLVADSQVIVQGEGLAQAVYYPQANEATVVFSSQGQAIYGRAGSGETETRIESEGESVRWAMGAGDVQIAVQTIGDGQVVTGISGMSSIQVQAVIDERVTPAVIEPGDSFIRLTSTADQLVSKSVRLEGEIAGVVVETVAEGRLVIQAAQGDGAVELVSEGEGRLATQVRASVGESAILLFARGVLSTRHYVYADGACVIQLATWGAKAGIPPIPSQYVPAPRGRTIIVARDPRDLPVPRERRAIA